MSDETKARVKKSDPANDQPATCPLLLMPTPKLLPPKLPRYSTPPASV